MYIFSTLFFENNAREIQNLNLTKVKITEKMISFSKIFFIIYFLFWGCGIPIWLLVLVRNTYYPFSKDSLYIILVFALQLITIALFSSYFSALSSRKELSNTLTNLASIDYQIEALIIKGEINEESVSNLENSFLTAKQYELVIDDNLKFVNFYGLNMHKTYIRQL